MWRGLPQSQPPGVSSLICDAVIWSAFQEKHLNCTTSLFPSFKKIRITFRSMKEHYQSPDAWRPVLSSVPKGQLWSWLSPQNDITFSILCKYVLGRHGSSTNSHTGLGEVWRNQQFIIQIFVTMQVYILRTPSLSDFIIMWKTYLDVIKRFQRPLLARVRPMWASEWPVEASESYCRKQLSENQYLLEASKGRSEAQGGPLPMTQKKCLRPPNDKTNTTKVRSFQLLYSYGRPMMEHCICGLSLVGTSLRNTQLYAIMIACRLLC